MNVWPNEEILLFNSHLHGYVYTYKCIIYNKMHKYVNANYDHHVYHTKFVYVQYVTHTDMYTILCTGQFHEDRDKVVKKEICIMTES